MKRFEFELSDEDARLLDKAIGGHSVGMQDVIYKGMTDIREPVKFEYGNEDVGRLVLVATAHDAGYEPYDQKGTIQAHAYNSIDGSRHVHNIPIADLEALIEEKRVLDKGADTPIMETASLLAEGLVK